VQKLLIDRMIKIRMQLDLLDERLTRGEWSPRDSRTYGGLVHAQRLTARELGLKSAAPPPTTLAEREGAAA
jgi:acyl-CoA thioesterase